MPAVSRTDRPEPSMGAWMDGRPVSKAHHEEVAGMGLALRDQGRRAKTQKQ